MPLICTCSARSVPKHTHKPPLVQAIKKITNIFEHVSDATRILREIKLLRLLKHPGLVLLLPCLCLRGILKFVLPWDSQQVHPPCCAMLCHSTRQHGCNAGCLPALSLAAACVSYLCALAYFVQLQTWWRSSIYACLLARETTRTFMWCLSSWRPTCTRYLLCRALTGGPCCSSAHSKRACKDACRSTGALLKAC